VVVLLDTSGSMQGEPLDQARRIVSALVGSLGDSDRLEMIEFSDAPRGWKRSPVAATVEARRSALEWLRALRASGSTEMRDAMTEALRPLREGAQRQVVLVTDGQIGFESEVVAEVLARLPAASRLHTVGVGSAVNRSLTAPAARAGRGVEVVVGLGEDPERAAQALVARTSDPVVTELQVAGGAVAEHAPARLPDLFGGAPALVALRLRPEGGEVRVTGRTAGGQFERLVRVGPVEPGAGHPVAAALFGREAVEDLEMRLAAGEAVDGIEAAIKKLGLDFQISTRLTSWVAVSEEPAVDPTKPTRRVRVPHQLPHGMSVEGLGLRTAASPPAVMAQAVATRELFVTLTQPPLADLSHISPSSVHKDAEEGFQQKPSGPIRSRMSPPAAMAGSRGAGTRLEGRVVLDRYGRLVVEAQLPVDLDWQPPAAIGLVLADGTGATGRLVVEQTTALGTLVAGQTLRIVVEMDDPAFGTNVVELVFEMGGSEVAIVVGRARRGRKGWTVQRY
jgi:Ca-activated chloride channel family protein